MPPKKKAAAKKEETEETTIFEGLTFAFVGKLSKTQSALTELIESNGGAVSKGVTKKTTHIVTNQDEVDNGNSKLEGDCKVVSEDFIHESVKASKLLAEKDYALTAAEMETEKESAKRKAESEEEEEEEKPKKGAKKAKTGKKAAKEESEEEEEEKPKPKRGAKKGGKAEEEDEVESHEKQPAKEEKKIVKIQKKGRCAVDQYVPGAGSKHVLDQGGVIYACMLNQTDIGYGVKGHNKFYVIQALEDDGGGRFYVFTRWGRVGVPGQNKLETFGSASQAISNFEKKFKDKTKNNWSNRANFEHVDGKYDMIDMDYGNDAQEEEEDDIDEKIEKKRQARKEVGGSKLDPRVQDLISMIFDLKMFQDTLVEFELDVKKMPLGKISKAQIQKGYEVLEQIEEELNEKKPDKKTLQDLASKFYTIIPHDFGFKLPPAITDKESLQKKMDMLQVLGDMEVAQTLISQEEKQEVENPIDAKYKMLNNDIVPLDKKSDEYNRLETYLNNTKESWKLTLLDVYKVNRAGELDNFKKFDDLEHRKLLWHGSKVAVFAAILTTGLKIMPHSGGRVGRGLYFADMIGKSAGYCGLHNNIGLLLLNEVALGKIHEITRDDPSLVVAPKPANSVLAKGLRMPDPKDDFADKELSHTEHPVIIPQGKIKTLSHSSTFTHNEFLVYDAGQVTMKYLLKVKWN